MLNRLAYRCGAASVAAVLLLLGLESTASFVVATAQAASASDPTATLSASPTSIAPGGSTTLTWSSTNATVCNGYGGLATGGGSAGSVSVTPITTTTYGLSCSSSNGVASTSAVVTVSQTNVINANGNCAGVHAGTAGDPYPFDCIVNAINSVPSGGGTVIVPDGVWQTQTTYNINRGNFNLVGNSLNAIISLTGSNPVNINSGSNVRVSNLTLDGSPYTDGYINAFHFANMQNTSLTNCTVVGVHVSGLSNVLFEGGANNAAIGNNLIPGSAGAAGGSQLQFNPLGGTTNAGFLVQGNTGDSTGLLIIGLNSALITANNFNNRSLGTTIAIQVAPALGQTGVVNTDGITIDANTVDAGVGSLNGAFISEISQDPGAIGAVQNLVISNNIIKATNAILALQTYDEGCLLACPLATTLNSKIINNQLTSFWTGSLLSIRGGTNGKVDGVIVEGNVLTGPPGAINQILQDAHTYNATITGNSVSSTAITSTLTASPASIASGQSSTLTWSSTNATSCTGTGFPTGGAVSGSASVSPTGSTTYSVACSGSGGTSSASASVTVMSDMTPPSVPTALTGAAVSESQINLTWNASADNVGVAGYHVYKNGSLVATVTTTSYVSLGLSPSTIYTYSVDAFDAAGNTSSQTARISVKTPKHRPHRFSRCFGLG